MIGSSYLLGANFWAIGAPDIERYPAGFNPVDPDGQFETSVPVATTNGAVSPSKPACDLPSRIHERIKVMPYSTNYHSTLITVAEDCPVREATPPDQRAVWHASSMSCCAMRPLV